MSFAIEADRLALATRGSTVLRLKETPVACRVLVLGACCSGKTSLCDELRPHHRSVIECDEAVMGAAGGVWPASAEENRRLVIESAAEAIAMSDVIFLTSWVPTEMLEVARDSGFTIALISMPLQELERRNRERLAEGGHSDVEHWFEPQLENYEELLAAGLIDVALDGTLPLTRLAEELTLLCRR